MLVLVNWIARNVRERSTVVIVHNAVCRSSDSLWLFRFHFNVDGLYTVIYSRTSSCGRFSGRGDILENYDWCHVARCQLSHEEVR